MRIETWDVSLIEYLDAAKNITFEWGVNDCALWASSFVDLITGSNYAADWINQYTNEEEAIALMTSRGFASYEEIADSHLPIIKTRQASRGDLVLHESGALGICDGRRSWFLGASGIGAVLTLSCVKAWRVE